LRIRRTIRASSLAFSPTASHSEPVVIQLIAPTRLLKHKSIQRSDRKADRPRAEHSAHRGSAFVVSDVLRRAG